MPATGHMEPNLQARTGTSQQEEVWELDLTGASSRRMAAGSAQSFTFDFGSGFMAESQHLRRPDPAGSIEEFLGSASGLSVSGPSISADFSLFPGAAQQGGRAPDPTGYLDASSRLAASEVLAAWSTEPSHLSGNMQATASAAGFGVEYAGSAPALNSMETAEDILLQNDLRDSTDPFMEYFPSGLSDDLWTAGPSTVLNSRGAQQMQRPSLPPLQDLVQDSSALSGMMAGTAKSQQSRAVESFDELDACATEVLPAVSARRDVLLASLADPSEFLQPASQLGLLGHQATFVLQQTVPSFAQVGAAPPARDVGAPGAGPGARPEVNGYSRLGPGEGVAPRDPKAPHRVSRRSIAALEAARQTIAEKVSGSKEEAGKNTRGGDSARATRNEAGSSSSESQDSHVDSCQNDKPPTVGVATSAPMDFQERKRLQNRSSQAEYRKRAKEKATSDNQELQRLREENEKLLKEKAQVQLAALAMQKRTCLLESELYSIRRQAQPNAPLPSESGIEAMFLDAFSRFLTVTYHKQVSLSITELDTLPVSIAKCHLDGVEICKRALAAGAAQNPHSPAYKVLEAQILACRNLRGPLFLSKSALRIAITRPVPSNSLDQPVSGIPEERLRSVVARMQMTTAQQTAIVRARQQFFANQERIIQRRQAILDELTSHSTLRDPGQALWGYSQALEEAMTGSEALKETAFEMNTELSRLNSFMFNHVVSIIQEGTMFAEAFPFRCDAVMISNYLAKYVTVSDAGVQQLGHGGLSQ